MTQSAQAPNAEFPASFAGTEFAIERGPLVMNRSLLMSKNWRGQSWIPVYQ